MDLIVSKGDVIFVDSVPLLNTDFVRTRASLGGHQLLQVSNSVVLTARATCQSVHSGIAVARAAGLKSQTYLHLTLTFLPSLSFRITSIILDRAAASLTGSGRVRQLALPCVKVETWRDACLGTAQRGSHFCGLPE